MKLFIIKVLKFLFIPFGIVFEALKGEKNKIIILMYHRVNNDIEKEISVTLANFKWQMDYLQKKHFEVITMDEAESKIRNKNIKGKYVVLTFDDGYEDFYINAFPIIKQHEFPSIIYVVPGYVESSRVFWWDHDIGKSSLLKWDQLLELNKSGLVDLGSHTMNHYDLNKIGGHLLVDEMRISKQIMESKLNKGVKHFAYPRGIFSVQAEEAAKVFYETGVLIFDGQNITPSCNTDHLMKLKRIPVQRSDGKYLFIARIKGWLVIEEFCKRVLSKY